LDDGSNIEETDFFWLLIVTVAIARQRLEKKLWEIF